METTNEQARRLSSGTIATLTGLRNYDEIEDVRNWFIEYIQETSDNSETWQQAWKRFSQHVFESNYNGL